MDIRGIIKFSLLDYPGKLSCVIFVRNCNYRCSYCYNSCLLLDPESQPRINEEEFFHFLEKRKGKLDAVVVSGGEPTLQNGLYEFIEKIKQMGFLVKIDTNGSNPGIVRTLFQGGKVDYIGIDYKGPKARYQEVTCTDIYEVGESVSRSIKYALEAEIKLDVRTTVHKAMLSISCLKMMREELNELGVKRWNLQQFYSSGDTLDTDLDSIGTYSDLELKQIAAMFNNTDVRGLKTV